MTTFYAFATKHGLILRDVIADGRVHRVPTEMHPRKRNGAYAFDGERGFVQAWDQHDTAIPFRGEANTAMPVAPARRQALRDERKHAQGLARAIVARSGFLPHPYLARKGFPHGAGLVDPEDGRLIVPMHDAANYGALLSVQRISSDGSKKFLRGGTAKDAVYHLGRGPKDVLVEGYATGLSVRAAFELMYQKARVVVCFSAGNLAGVARLYPKAIVVADNDASGAGKASAEKAGRPWVMPQEVGMDANDLHQQCGIRALCDLLRAAELRAGARQYG